LFTLRRPRTPTSFPCTTLFRSEESAKAALLVVLIATGRVGFLVDAAVLGFSIGTGFALFENIWYLQTLPHASLMLKRLQVPDVLDRKSTRLNSSHLVISYAVFC